MYKRTSKLCNSRVLRIIDANLNRLREGLRVCEDTTRFILNNLFHTRALKQIRHAIEKIVVESKIGHVCLLEYRNVKGDVGVDFSWMEDKDNWQDIFFANMQRTKESLRVLEEFFKLFDNKTWKRFKDLRFKVYDTEKRIIAKSPALSHSKYYSHS